LATEEKTSRSFYELCYDPYKTELDEAEKLYQKVGVMLIILPVLSSLVVKLGRIDLLGQLFSRIDIFIYYLSFCISLLLIAVSVTFAIFCVFPRKYKRLGDLGDWQDWKEKYEAYIKKINANETIDEAMMRDICPRLADAQTKNAPINEKRRRYFQKSVLLASLTTVPIAIEAFFYLLLKIQEGEFYANHYSAEL